MSIVYLGSQAYFHIPSFDGVVQDSRCHQTVAEDWYNYDILCVFQHRMMRYMLTSLSTE
jgi:hypothetical protein